MIIFLKTAKTGGTSILDAVARSGKKHIKFLRPLVGVRVEEAEVVTLVHRSTVCWFKKHHPSTFARAEKVAVFRCPVRRGLSGFHFRNEKRRSRLADEMTFLEALEHPPTETEDPWGFIHFTEGQLCGMGLEEGEEKNVRILRFEHLASDYEKWSLGRLPPLRHLNSQPPYPTGVSPREIAAASRLWERDFRFAARLADDR